MKKRQKIWTMMLILLCTASFLNSTVIDDAVNTEFLTAIENNDLDSVRELLSQGVHPDSVKNENGSTALMLASFHGVAGIAETLIEHGANVNAQRLDGWTALMRASYEGHTDIVNLLIERGSDVNMKSPDGYGQMLSVRCIKD